VIISIVSLAGLISLNLLSDMKVYFTPVLYGWVLSLANVLLGTRYILKSIKKDNKKFFAVVFGSMTVRLFVTLILILIGLLVLKLNEIYFIFSLLGFYFAFIAIEIIFLNCNTKSIKSNKIDIVNN
jgi:hypothetical protein